MKLIKRMSVVLLAVMGFAFTLHAERITVSCRLATQDRLLTLGAPVSYSCVVKADSGVKSVKLSGLPSGLKYDKKTQRIAGTPTKSGNFTVSIAVTTKARGKDSMTLGTVRVPELSDIAIGEFKGVMAVGSRAGLLTMKIGKNGKTTGKLEFGDKKKLTIKSGYYTNNTENTADFKITFSDGSSQTIRLYNLSSSYNLPIPNVGAFVIKKDSKWMLGVFQDVFRKASTKVTVKRLIGKKHVYQAKNGLTYTISPSGAVTVKGTFKGKKVNCKTTLVTGWYENGYFVFVCYFGTADNRVERMNFGIRSNGTWYDNYPNNH